MAKKGSIIKKIFLWFFILILLGGGAVLYMGYRMFYMPNTSAHIKTYEIILIPTGSSFEQIMDTLKSENVLAHEQAFLWLVDLKKCKDKFKPGRYRIKSGMSSNEIVNMLRAGLQEPVTVTFNNIRTKDQLVSRVCKKLEADSTEMRQLLMDEKFLMENYGMKSNTIISMFIPNTYQLYWNTSAKEFLDRMAREYKLFWNQERKAKLKDLGLTQTQVSTLASLVQEEQQRFIEERPIIAGLYLNRLKIGVPLQCDPTLKFILNDFAVQRLLEKDKEIDSPYNTYKYAGLPPGPINIPEISSLEAVLNYNRNKYMYMCAKEDFSGRNVFARTLEEHNLNAARYRKALNKAKILR